ncbi:hypothetical protein H9P43_000973 [Blastocladiella emersonii ATCC 22665]|nr:hypothetical protein H9P43_000973 [Blastocladiella emersonii ATCC 22665]
MHDKLIGLFTCSPKLATNRSFACRKAEPVFWFRTGAEARHSLDLYTMFAQPTLAQTNKFISNKLDGKRKRMFNLIAPDGAPACYFLRWITPLKRAYFIPAENSFLPKCCSCTSERNRNHARAKKAGGGASTSDTVRRQIVGPIKSCASCHKMKDHGKKFTFKHSRMRDVCLDCTNDRMRAPLVADRGLRIRHHNMKRKSFRAHTLRDPVGYRFRALLKGARARNIPVYMPDRKKLEAKFKLPCKYCGHVPVGVKLIGINRINSNYGYFDKNTVLHF